MPQVPLPYPKDDMQENMLDLCRAAFKNMSQNFLLQMDQHFSGLRLKEKSMKIPQNYFEIDFCDPLAQSFQAAYNDKFQCLTKNSSNDHTFLVKSYDDQPDFVMKLMTGRILSYPNYVQDRALSEYYHGLMLSASNQVTTEMTFTELPIPEGERYGEYAAIIGMPYIKGRSFKEFSKKERNEPEVRKQVNRAIVFDTIAKRCDGHGDNYLWTNNGFVAIDYLYGYCQSAPNTSLAYPDKTKKLALDSKTEITSHLYKNFLLHAGYCESTHSFSKPVYQFNSEDYETQLQACEESKQNLRNEPHPELFDFHPGIYQWMLARADIVEQAIMKKRGNVIYPV